eukprot:5005091-Amphidinium_carterae.1
MNFPAEHDQNKFIMLYFVTVVHDHTAMKVFGPDKESGEAAKEADETQQVAVRAWQQAELAYHQWQFELAKTEKVVKGADASAWKMEYCAGAPIGMNHVPTNWADMGGE